MIRNITVPIEDPDDNGVTWALQHAGIDRNLMPAVAAAVEAQWWESYAEAVVDALEMFGTGAVATMAEARLAAWWRDNAERLIEQQPAWTLHDSDTGEMLGPATNAQVDASLAELDGHILIDADGDVVLEGTWPAQQPGVRRVYVA